MKKILLILPLLFLSIVIAAQTNNKTGSKPDWLLSGYTEGYEGNDFDFIDNEVIFWSEYTSEELYRSDYHFETENSMTYLVLPGASKRLLCLANDIVCLLYDNASSEPYFMGFWSLGGSERIDPFQSTDFSASSELKEGAITYGAGNLASFNLKTPWVEGVDGNGIGEYVTFRMNFTYLYLFSGYISYDKPYLYEQNARPKKIKITVTDKGNSQEFIFDLEDTPNPQTLTFPDWMKGEAKLEILEVYPGTKYQDTCIHALLGRVF